MRLEHAAGTVRLADGKVQPIEGVVQLSLEWRGGVDHCMARVLPTLSSPVVLGCDFMGKRGACVHLGGSGSALRSAITDMVFAPGETKTVTLTSDEMQGEGNLEVPLIVTPEPQAGLMGWPSICDRRRPQAVWHNGGKEAVRLSRTSMVATVELASTASSVAEAAEPDAEHRWLPEGVHEDAEDMERMRARIRGLDLGHLSQEHGAKLREVLLRRAAAFGDSQSPLPLSTLPAYTIDTAGAAPVRQRSRPFNPKELELIRDELRKLSDMGIIERVSSPWNSGVVLVPKKAAPGQPSTARLCIDLRRVNDLTKTEGIQTPSISQQMQGLVGKRYFSGLDLSRAFWSIGLDHESTLKTAFSVPGICGQFGFRRVVMGAKNSSAWLQSCLEELLGELLQQGVKCYADDLLVGSTTLSEHLRLLDALLQRIEKARLKINLDKSTFAKPEIAYLGSLVSEAGIRPDPARVRCLEAWPTPQNLGELRRFLGSANFVRAHIAHYATIVEPLLALTRKAVPWVWHADCERAFRRLKRAIQHAVLLQHVDYSKTFYLTTDSSLVGMAAMLSQFAEDGSERPVAFAAKTTTAAERNYASSEAEIAGVVFGLDAFANFLRLGKVVIRTDNSGAVWLVRKEHLSGKWWRWAAKLQEYDYQIEHIKAARNVFADALSRMGLRVETQDTPQRGIAHASAAAAGGDELPGEGDEWGDLEERSAEQEVHGGQSTAVQSAPTLEQVTAAAQRGDARAFAQLQRGEPIWGDVMHLLETGQMPTEDRDATTLAAIQSLALGASLDQHGRLRLHQLSDSDKRCPRLCIPAPLRQWVIGQAHDQAHMGVARTHWAVANTMWWPGMTKDIRDFVTSCTSCAQRKSRQGKPYGKLQPVPVTRPGQIWGIDFMGPLDSSASGARYILVAIDRFTKFAVAVPMRTMESEETVQALTDKVFCTWGVPESLSCDQGGTFKGRVFREACKRLGVRIAWASAFHPEANGQAERLVRVLTDSLAILCAGNFGEWEKHLQRAVFFNNTTASASTGETPYMLQMGRDPSGRLQTLWDLQDDDNGDVKQALLEYKQALLERMTRANEEAATNLEAARERQRRQYDQRHQLPPFEVGDRVWLAVKRKAKGHANKLTHDRYIGPFRLVQRVTDVTFRVRNAENRLLRQAVHVGRMKRYVEREARPHVEVPPPPDDFVEEREDDGVLIDVRPEQDTGVELDEPAGAPGSEDEVFVIERVLRWRTHPEDRRLPPGERRRQCLVRWRGYSPKHDSWVDENELIDL